ncbi:hypothetical protein BMS3Abin10_00400 [bacterium BMS3Abin10]|nr:hypothetical protein BMS3Abin10_00400 [bacterium BMS3Abin10]
MKKKRRIKKPRIRFRHYLLAAVILFTAATLLSYLYFKPMMETEVPFIKEIESQRLKAKTDENNDGPGRLYASREEGLSGDDRFGRGRLLVRAEDIIKAYMEPHNVKLLDLYMDKNGIIYADLSSELRKNFNGDASEEYQLILDLYDRMKKSIPGFSSLKILIDGKEVESFGGHIDISKPIGEEIRGVIVRKTYRHF